MEMVATSKMRKTQDRMAASRPYSETIRNVISHVSKASIGYKHPFLVEREVKKVGILVISTDRGMCGGLNVNLFKTTLNQIKDWKSQNATTELGLIGSKGISFFRSLGFKVKSQLSGLGDNGLFQDSVYNERSGEYVPVSFNSMMVSVDTESTTLEQAAFTLLNFLHIVICVWSIVLFVRLVISINKSDIFNWKNVHRLRLLGAALIISFCTALLPAYLTFRSVGNVFSVHGYELHLSDTVNTTTLVLGISTLIVAEVFAIGLKMKEEQDLTI